MVLFGLTLGGPDSVPVEFLAFRDLSWKSFVTYLYSGGVPC